MLTPLLTLLYPNHDIASIETRIESLIDSVHVGVIERELNDPVIITYGDSIVPSDNSISTLSPEHANGNLANGELDGEYDGEPPLQTLKKLLDEYLHDVIGAVHVLPFFPYSSDDGFSVIDYYTVRPDLGNWTDMENLAKDYDLMVDLVINHCSRHSDWFKKFIDAPNHSPFFIKVPDPSIDTSMIVRPRTLPLFTPVNSSVGKIHVWTTFSDDQIDLNFENPDVLIEMINILLSYLKKGARIIRLDAIAFLWKEYGTNCMHLPQTHAIVKILRYVMENQKISPNAVLLTETNVPHAENVSYCSDEEAHMVYNFSLPPLLLYSFHNSDSSIISTWASSLSDDVTFFNFSASHDGIGLRGLEGLVDGGLVEAMVDGIVDRVGAHVSYRSVGDFQVPYELNCTFFDALSTKSSSDVTRFLSSQAIVLALKGVPAVYISSLWGAHNAHDNVERLGHARAINREKFVYPLLLENPHHSTVFTQFVRILKARHGLREHFSPTASQRILKCGKQCFGVVRDEAVYCFTNFSSESVEIELHDQQFDIAMSTIGVDDGKVSSLAPYETKWLVFARDR